MLPIHRGKARQEQRGVALIAALFALMLISALALAMVFSTTTESAVGANFRDARVAEYAANAGIQQGRERLMPSAADYLGGNAPATLPTLPAALFTSPMPRAPVTQSNPQIPATRILMTSFAMKTSQGSCWPTRETTSPVQVARLPPRPLLFRATLPTLIRPRPSASSGFALRRRKTTARIG